MEGTRFIGAVAALALSVLVADATPLGDQLTAAVQPILSQYADRFNTSFSLGYADSTTVLSLVAGVDDHGSNSLLSNDGLIPMGSVTKTWTGAAVLQLVERGTFGLDDPVAPLVNKILQADNGTTLELLFGENAATAAKITVRMLLGMRAGLNDYDDNVFRKITFTEPGVDLSPYDLLHMLNTTFICEPGTCGAYSSMSFEILGLVLAQAAGAATWSDFDQLSVLPPGVRPDFKNVQFPLKGLCSEHEKVVHQYSVAVSGLLQNKVSFFDIRDDSCLNGWTCGNIAASSSDVANFYYKLLGKKQTSIVSDATKFEMAQLQPLTVGWSVGLEYGLAVMAQGYATKPGSSANDTFVLGHGGEDYGSGSPLSGVNFAFDFGINVASNSETGMNCSLKGEAFKENFQANFIVSCNAYQAVLSVVAADRNAAVPQLDCTPRKHHRARRLQENDLGSAGLGFGCA